MECRLTISPQFIWSDRWNGNQESFWIIASNGGEVLHSEIFVLLPKDVGQKNSKEIIVTFFLPYEIEEGEEKVRASVYYEFYIENDRWIGALAYKELYLDDIEIPEKDYPHTKLLQLNPLPISVLKNENYESLYWDKFEFFNPVQT